MSEGQTAIEASDLTRPASRVTIKPQLKAAGVDV